jgi:serine/threonine protein kinase
VAYDDQLDRQVALKLLLREHANDEHARDRLLREAQALARLSHPNVVQIHEAGIHEGQVFLAIEEPASRKQVPRWLRKVARRGLAVRPDDRFPDMEALDHLEIPSSVRAAALGMTKTV